MNKSQKKKRKLLSIEMMEKIKVEEWKRYDVYTDISIYEWVELKRKKVG